MASRWSKFIRIRGWRGWSRKGSAAARKIILEKLIDYAKLMPPLRKSLLTRGQDSCKKAEILKPSVALMPAFLGMFARSGLKCRDGVQREGPQKIPSPANLKGYAARSQNFFSLYGRRINDQQNLEPQVHRV